MKFKILILLLAIFALGCFKEQPEEKNMTIADVLEIYGDAIIELKKENVWQRLLIKYGYEKGDTFHSFTDSVVRVLIENEDGYPEVITLPDLIMRDYLSRQVNWELVWKKQSQGYADSSWKVWRDSLDAMNFHFNSTDTR